MIKLGILFGGRSREHDVSLMSAASVLRTLDKRRFTAIPIGITRDGRWLPFEGSVDAIEDGSWQKLAEAAFRENPEAYGIDLLGAGPGSLRSRIDFALPILHGPYGEDGTIQGLFEMLDMPYGGCGVTGSAVAMDKILAKNLFSEAGLPQGSYVAIVEEDMTSDEEQVLDRIESTLSYPVFVKPANMGSSVGISKVKNREQLKEALELSLLHDRRILVEQAIDCREIEVGILGNGDPRASSVGEIIPSAEFYDYTAKYCDGGRSQLCIPADIPEDRAGEIRRIALAAYRLLDCSGFARVDFFLERKTGRILINEINTIPGFTKFSMFPLLWKDAGLNYPELIERIVILGYERYHAKNSRQAAVRLR